MSTRILRLRRTDQPKEHILLRVEQTSTTKPLDLKLIATEHEHLYHGEIKTSSVLSFKTDRFKGDEDDIRDIFCYCFLQEKPDGADMSALRNLEVLASMEQSDIVIVIRRLTGEITTRIATIKLGQDDEREEVSPFDWVDTAVCISDELRRQLREQEAVSAARQLEVSKLKEELDTFVKLKKANEDELMVKFAALLNSKKSKIRELQALLADSGVDYTSQNVSRKRKAKEGADTEMQDADQPEEEGTSDTPPATDDEDGLDAAVSVNTIPPITELPYARKHEIAANNAPGQNLSDGDDDDTDDEL